MIKSKLFTIEFHRPVNFSDPIKEFWSEFVSACDSWNRNVDFSLQNLMKQFAWRKIHRNSNSNIARATLYMKMKLLGWIIRELAKFRLSPQIEQCMENSEWFRGVLGVSTRRYNWSYKFNLSFSTYIVCLFSKHSMRIKIYYLHIGG